MTSSIGMTSAVSDYENLNRKILPRHVMDRQSGNESEDEDFLPLKPKKPEHMSSNKNVIFHETNINNSNVQSRLVGENPFGQSEISDDMRQSLRSAPVPVAWSPGMIITSNPSLFITPQKTSASNDLSLSVKESILEPESVNKIPKPSAWSPGMKAQFDPNLFITPEKCVGKKVLADICEEKKESKVDNCGPSKQRIPTKTKETHSVRFTLPSSTSEDDTPDPSSDTESPITLRGCDMSIEGKHSESPVWKTFSPQKTYNPGAYSDESSLDESFLSFLPNSKHVPSYDIPKISYVTGINSKVPQSSASSKLPIISSETVSSDSGILKLNEPSQHFDVVELKDSKLPVSNLKPHKTEQPNSNLPVKTKIKNEKKNIDKIPAKSEPNLPISPSSTHEPPAIGSTVVREMKNNLLSTEYSFPFELKGGSEGCEYEHVFARPEFNSTLKVRAELDTLYEKEVDVTKAVEASLAKSEFKRLELNEKAAACTNRISSQFKNLVDLNTSVESLCDRIVRMRTNTVPSKRKGIHIGKKLSGPDKAPDLMEFFTSDLQKESPDLTLPGITPVTSRLMTAPQDLAFDLYRHNRIWHGINDF